jgi:hypothetical protein
MVRRWSRVVISNRQPLNDLTRSSDAAFDVNVNSSMYLRKAYASETSLRRRQWSRRRHLSNWLALSNILKDWASAYRFYRNYTRFALNQNFSSSSLIAFDLVNSLNTSSGLVKGSEDVVVAVVNRRWLNYFCRFNTSRWALFRQLKSSLPIFVSFSPLSIDRASIPEMPSFRPLLSCEDASLTSFHPSSINQALPKLAVARSFDLLFQLTQRSALAVYRLLILLTLFRL